MIPSKTREEWRRLVETTANQRGEYRDPIDLRYCWKDDQDLSIVARTAMPQLLSENAALLALLRECRDGFEAISKREGPFSTDREEFAMNVIESMASIARKGVSKLDSILTDGGKTDDLARKGGE